MNTSSALRRNASFIAGFGLMASPLAALSSPAFAASADCTAVDPSATEVLTNICEVQYLETGDYSLTPPSGVTKLTALIVGGGGAANYEAGTYAGGGGAVVYVANVDASTTVDVTVGVGAQSASDLQGGSSSVNSDVAAGGLTGIPDGLGTGVGGTSGNGNVGSSYDDDKGSGGGAGGVADSYSGGLGVLASAAANDSAMWPSVDGEPYYGAGGSVQSMAPGYGDAGWGADGTGQRDYGMDGLVILRWTSVPPADTGLANTGLSSWNVALGAMFAAGLFFVALGSFTARSELRFAGSRERLVGLLKDANERLNRPDASTRN